MAVYVNSAKVKEGDKLIAEAEKCLKTSWFKWSSDYDGAAHAFDKAALAYRNAKAYDKARDAYERAADVYYSNQAIFHSGKAFEQAANACKDMKLLEQAAVFLERASNRYHESGHGDTAGQMLIKAARLVDTVNPRKAADYYLQTADLHETEDKYRESANAVRGAINMWARARDFDKLLEALGRLKELYNQLNSHKHLYELAATEILVHLHNDDSVAAGETLITASVIPGFGESDEAPILDKLIDAYRDGDVEVLQQCCDDAVFRSMDNDIAILARDLKRKHHGFLLQPERSTAAQKPKSAQQSYSVMQEELFGGSGSRPRKQRVEEREEGGGSGQVAEAESRPEEGGVQVAEAESRPEVEGGVSVKDDDASESDNPYGGMLT